MKGSWRTTDTALWLWSLLFVAISVAANRLPQKGSLAPTQMEDQDPLHLSTFTIEMALASLSAVTLALGLVWFRGQILARIRRRLNLSVKPFHWRIVQLLNLSPTWIKSFREGDGLTLVQFIDGLPITGQLSRQTIVDHTRGVSVLPWPAAEAGPLLLEHLVNQRAWYDTEQAQQLARLIASSLMNSQHLTFEKTYVWGCHLPFDGRRFDMSQLSAEHKEPIEREILTALRLASGRHLQLGSMRTVQAVDDELDRRVGSRADDAGSVHESPKDEEVVLPTPAVPEDVPQVFPGGEDAGTGVASPSRAESRVDDAGSDHEEDGAGTGVTPAPLSAVEASQPPSEEAGGIVDEEASSAPADPTADRLRRRYREATFLGHRDPFELSGQIVAHYYQSLELGVPREVVSEDEVVMDWSPLTLSQLMNVASNGVILMGEVGAGKTTLCRRIAQQWALSEDDQPSWLRQYRYVLMVPLREWLSRFNELDIESEADRDRHVLAWLIRGLWDYCVKDITYEGPYPPMRDVLLLLDGYDEVVHTSPDGVFGQVLSQLLDRTRVEAPHVIVTTRPHVSLEERFGAFVKQARRCRIVGLPQDNQQAMVEGYFGERRVPDSVDPGRPLFSVVFQSVLRRQATLKHLQRNPLLLKMLCYLFYTQTTSRGTRSIFNQDDLRLTPIYRETIEALKRRASGHLGGWEPSPQGEEVLKALANQREAVIDPDRLHSVFDELGIHFDEDRHRLLEEVSSQLGMLYPLDTNSDPLESHWSFLHKSFQEYYRALALRDRLLGDESDENAAWVYAEVRDSLKGDGQLGFFLAGNLSEGPGERATSALQRFIDLLAGLKGDYLKRKSFWGSLTEVAAERCCDLRLPNLARLESLGGLHNAAGTGSVLLCQWVLDQVPESDRLDWVQQAHSFGRTLLHDTASDGHESVCRWLVELVPKPDRLAWIRKRDCFGFAALHSAAAEGHESVCRCLVEHAPEPNRLTLIQQTDDDDDTALHLAASQGHESVCRCLVEHASEPDRLTLIQQANEDGNTALHNAAAGGHESVCRCLVEHAPESDRLTLIQQADNYGATALHSAAAKGHESVCRCLVEHAPKPNRLTLIQQVDDDDDTALHLAASKGHESVCRCLVEHASEPDRLTLVQQGDEDSDTALHRAAAEGHGSVCRCLLEQVPKRDRLALIQQVNRHGRTALHSATAMGVVQIEMFPTKSSRYEWVFRCLVEQLPAAYRAEFVNRRDYFNKSALDYLPEDKAQLILDLLPATDLRMPTTPSRPAAARPRGRLLGDEAVAVAREPSPTPSEGSIVGLEETKGEERVASGATSPR